MMQTVGIMYGAENYLVQKNITTARNKSNICIDTNVDKKTLNNISFNYYSLINFTSNKDIKLSPLKKARLQYQPKLPAMFNEGISHVKVIEKQSTEAIADKKQVSEIFKNTYGKRVIDFNKIDNNEVPIDTPSLKVGIILSGGQAPGGHNVISGIFDALKEANPDTQIFGFKNGPDGIIKGESIELTKELIDKYRNTGGFDIIGSGRTKIKTKEQFDNTLKSCNNLNLDSVVVIGGDDSNTNAALLDEFFTAQNANIKVIGVPKTIDGDLKNDEIETSFGFDTATKTYSEMIGNVQNDAVSANKYWHFIKLMGRSASHVTLECALQTHPNIALISEEIQEKGTSLDEVVESIANTVAKRAENGVNHGVILIPEGVIEFIPEMKGLIENLNDVISDNEEVLSTIESKNYKLTYIKSSLDEKDEKFLSSLPQEIQLQLIADRDPHGNVQVSKIKTEELLMEMVNVKLNEMKEKGEYNGKFKALGHFYGYEGRCAMPSNFDADYCYSLGYSTAALLNSGKSGYLASVKDLELPANEWDAGGVPLTSMMNIEERDGEDVPVIQKALVHTDNPAFKEFVNHRDEWAIDNDYQYPGPIQFYGFSEVSEAKTQTLELEKL